MPENAAVVPSHTPARRRRVRNVGAALLLALAALLAFAVATASAAELAEVNLAKYKRVGRYELRSPTNSTPLANSLRPPGRAG
jgi:hypothetical protein